MSQLKALPSQGFLTRLIEEIPEKELFSPDTIFIFPTRRAGLYFRYYLFKKRPCASLLPQIISFSDFLAELATEFDSRPLLPKADQAWLLWKIVKNMPSFERVAQSFDRFFPWGLRLAEVLDQLERELVDAQNIVYPPEEELPLEARIFLEHLGDIQKSFGQKLKEMGFITPGQRQRILAENCEKLSGPKGPLHLVGFFMLTRAEQKIFKEWLKRGATIWWRLEGKDLPSIYKELAKVFGLKIDILTAKIKRPSFHFYEAPDVHHELTTLKKILPEHVEDPDDTLILLCVAGHLIPLLYELPENTPLNITLGYPLFRTPLAQLFLLFAELRENMHQEEVHIPSYLKLIKHPYLRGLKFEGEKAYRFFHLIEKRLREHGSPYLSLEQIEALAEEETYAHFLRWFHNQLLKPWLQIETTSQLAKALRRITKECTRERLLHAEEDTPEILLEKAFLFAFETEILPSLEKVSFANEPLAAQTIFTFLKELLRNIRAPFEGEPLCGLQVMGLLETRLLSFKRVFVLDANEGYLPSIEEVNPLLPEGVKPILGLPPRESEEIIERHHFFALVRTAEEVHIFYQSAISGKGEALGKKMRSRYVERLIWEEEQEEKKLSPEKISFIPLNLSPKAFARKESIVKGQAEKQFIENMLLNRTEGISATMLNTYLLCPVKFYFRYVLGLKPTKELTDFDAAELGEIIHSALEEYFRPYEGKHYAPVQDNDPERLISYFRELFKVSKLYQALGPERRFFVEETAIFRLKRYLEFLASEQPEGFTILKLEKKYSRKFQDFLFSGRLDRLEQRGEWRYVLDYKTGTFLKNYSQNHFEEKLLPYDPPNSLGAEDFFDFQERMPDIQLFLYLFLAGVDNAAYLQLATGNLKYIEKPLFQPKHLETAQTFMIENFPRLLDYLLKHIIEADAFYATQDDKTCGFCDYRLACECAKK